MEMSGAIAIPIIAGALATTATIAQGYGEYQEGKYQSKVMKANADVMQQNAARKRLETSINEDVMREQNRRQIARNQAAMLEQGNVGATGVGVLGQQATDLEQNVLNSRYQGLAAAEAQDIESYYLRQNAKWTKRSARNKFITDLLFTAPSNGINAFMGAGGNMKQPSGNRQTYRLSDGNKYEAWSLK